jgi:hypothetical protein
VEDGVVDGGIRGPVAVYVGVEVEQTSHDGQVTLVVGVVAGVQVKQGNPTVGVVVGVGKVIGVLQPGVSGLQVDVYVVQIIPTGQDETVVTVTGAPGVDV